MDTEAYRHLKEEERRAVALARAREDMPLYVLTNTRGFYGAAAILYEGLLEQCVRKFPGDVFVIPSSVECTGNDRNDPMRQSNRGGAGRNFV